MPAESLEIYGLDETATAASIASDALTAPPAGGSGGSSIASLGGGGDERYSNGEVKMAPQAPRPEPRAVSKGGHAATSTRVKSSKE